MTRAELLEWTVALTNEAGNRAVAMLQSERAVSLKADGTIVTNIDRAIERFLRDEITARFPDHAILGEEYGYDGRGENAPLWALDPIDGTVNLANDLPMWGVSVGLMEAGELTVGAVSFPQLGELYAGAKGLGATLNSVALPALSRGGPIGWEDAYGICSASVRQMNFEKVPCRLRVLGSAALEVCWTATGRLKGCQSIGVSLYDVAGGLCVAHEVGANAGWLSGTALSPTDFATAGKREDDLLITAPPDTMVFLRENLTYR